MPALQEHFADASNIVQAFDDAGFKTSYEALFGDPPEALLSKPSEAVATAAHGSSGDIVLEDEHKIKSAQFGGDTGVLELDEMVAEAFGAYGVTEVSGSAASHLVLWIVVRHLAQYGESSALWIDTTYDFSVDQAALALQNIPFEVGSPT
ncbi:hypothetical protein FRC04_011775 [Tulasnella sp. 424]|nr:hypothetical protein FRC04_011775 [Tulasnella sp. 424]